MTIIAESLTIRQVANGWVIHGKTPADVLHVAVSPDSLASAVSEWASASRPDAIVGSIARKGAAA